MIEVFYVTAERAGAASPGDAHAAVIRAAATGAPSSAVAPQMRCDMGKFFSREDAEKHTALGPGWYAIQIEVRLEREEEQHAAHQAHPEHGPAAWSRPPRPQALEPALAVIPPASFRGVEFPSAPIPPPPETKPEVLEEDSLDLPPVLTAEEHASAGPEGS